MLIVHACVQYNVKNSMLIVHACVQYNVKQKVSVNSRNDRSLALFHNPCPVSFYLTYIEIIGQKLLDFLYVLLSWW